MPALRRGNLKAIQLSMRQFIQPNVALLDREQNVLEIPKSQKTIDCSGCGKPVSVNPRVVMGFCAACSAKMCVKK